MSARANIGPEQQDVFADLIPDTATKLLRDRFLVPPFSVLDARQGYWQERKREWLSLGIQSEVGRDAVCCQIGDKATWEAEEKQVESTKKWSTSKRNVGLDDKTQRALGCIFSGGTTGSIVGRGQGTITGTSVFDPVLCELAYRWFCPAGGQVVDPFAGGSVRGVVAHILGLRYWGCDLRPEQIAANHEQAEAIVPNKRPTWLAGDALELLPDAPTADLIFSCPPYGNLEVYSDDPRDLSNMEWHTFVAVYGRIILAAIKRLRPNRFAAFVVADFRDGKGYYRNFVGTTVEAFEAAGARLYNEAILLTAIGSLPVRVGKQFGTWRKLGKTHQQLLVFYKGNPKGIRDEFVEL